jgi:hypothetical protein
MEQNVLYTITSLLTSLSWLLNDPNMTPFRICIYLLPMILPLFMLIDFKKFRWILVKFRPSSNALDFTARIRLRNWDEEPNSIIRNFSTVLWEWNRLNHTVNCKNLMEESVGNCYYNFENDIHDKRQQPIFVDDQTTFFWHAARPKIHYKMWMERNTDRDGISHSELLLTMRFFENSPSNVVEHIEYLKKEAMTILKNRAQKQRILVSVQETGESSEKGGPGFMIYEFKTTTSFANFFSEEAAIVKKELEIFMNDKKSYERTGRPWTYTILNEGPPGVGKTKLVKAVAALTGYTLIVINLNHITSGQKLYEAFHMSSLAGEHVPHDKRLYYIPEVDTQMTDILKNRNAKTLPNLVAIEDDKKTTTMTTTNNKPTLGEILNIIDGIPERHGHILIMDTNCLKELDPALIRPGRVDRILSWKPMSALCIKQYLENYFEVKVPKRAVLPDRKLTAAKLQSIVSNSANLEECLGSLRF